MAIAPALQIAGGIILGRAGIRALGLEGLGATVEQCEQWRRIATWAVPATDDERREASQNWNANCRETVAATAGGAQAAIAAGQGAQEASARELTDSQRAAAWLRSNPKPDPEDPEYAPWVIPAPECGPLDSECVECARQVLDYNIVAIQNAARRFRRAMCIWNCYRNRAVGRPDLCRDCRRYDELPLPARPPCAGEPVRAVRVGGRYRVPSADWVAAEPKKFLSQERAQQAESYEAASSSDSSPAPGAPEAAAPASFSPPVPEAVQRIIERLPEPVQANPWPWLAGAAVIAALLISRGGAA